MKRAFLLALALMIATTTAAQAQLPLPIPGVRYQCFYYNYYGLAKNGGVSVFNTIQVNADLWRGVETFQVNYYPYKDSQKIVFAKFQVLNSYGWYSDWKEEFTVAPSGPQCQDTEVFNNGSFIRFRGCTDGHSRECFRLD